MLESNGLCQLFPGLSCACAGSVSESAGFPECIQPNVVLRHAGAHVSTLIEQSPEKPKFFSQRGDLHRRQYPRSCRHSNKLFRHISLNRACNTVRAKVEGPSKAAGRMTARTPTSLLLTLLLFVPVLVQNYLNAHTGRASACMWTFVLLIVASQHLHEIPASLRFGEQDGPALRVSHEHLTDNLCVTTKSRCEEMFFPKI